MEEGKIGKVLFPHIILGKPVTVLGARFEPWDKGPAGAVASFEGDNRRADVLSACLTLAAYLARENVLTGDYIDRRISGTAFDKLLPYLKEPPKDAVKTVYWFAKYLKSSETDSIVMSLYNAFGTLPCGFDGVGDLFVSQNKKRLFEAFMRKTDECRSLDDETGPALNPRTLSAAELWQIEQVYITQAKQYFPEMFS